MMLRASNDELIWRNYSPDIPFLFIKNIHDKCLAVNYYLHKHKGIYILIKD